MAFRVGRPGGGGHVSDSDLHVHLKDISLCQEHSEIYLTTILNFFLVIITSVSHRLAKKG